jgi:hypothetical protein
MISVVPSSTARCAPRAGVPVFYIDAGGLNVMESNDGRKFEIRWLPGAPSGENYEVIRELTAHAA